VRYWNVQFLLKIVVRKEYSLSVFKTRVMKIIFGCKRGDVTGDSKNGVMRSFVISAVCHESLG
jgi:hypothetical protein